MTPTSRTLTLLRQQGFHAQVVERRIPGTFITQDAFGFGDILAFRAGQPGSVLVQTTSGPNAASRRKKILSSDLAKEWLLAGNWIRLDRWAKRGAKGQRKVWSASTEYITLDQFT